MRIVLPSLEQIKAAKCAHFLAADDLIATGGWCIDLGKVKKTFGPDVADEILRRDRKASRRRHEAELKGVPPKAKRRPPTPVRPRVRASPGAR
jgi:hypothetical protein